MQAQLEQGSSAASLTASNALQLELTRINTSKRNQQPRAGPHQPGSDGIRSFRLHFRVQQSTQQLVVAQAFTAATSAQSPDAAGSSTETGGGLKPGDLLLISSRQIQADGRDLVMQLSKPNTLHSLALVMQVVSDAAELEAPTDSSRTNSSNSNSSSSRFLQSGVLSFQVEVLQMRRAAGTSASRNAVATTTAAAAAGGAEMGSLAVDDIWELVQGEGLEQLLRSNTTTSSSSSSSSNHSVWFGLPLLSLATSLRIGDALQRISMAAQPPPLLKQLLAPGPGPGAGTSSSSSSSSGKGSGGGNADGFAAAGASGG